MDSERLSTLQYLLPFMSRGEPVIDIMAGFTLLRLAT